MEKRGQTRVEEGGYMRAGVGGVMQVALREAQWHEGACGQGREWGLLVLRRWDVWNVVQC